MALEIVFTDAQREKLRRLRVEQGLTWATLGQRLNMSRERVIKEAKAMGLFDERATRKVHRRTGGAGAIEDAKQAAGEAEDDEPIARVDQRRAMPAGHPVAMDVLLNAPRLEDRWKDEE